MRMLGIVSLSTLTWSFSLLTGLLVVHAWNYRRYILANMEKPPPLSSELAYTTKKIEANFSNFSAWHQRSKVLTSLWEQGKLARAASLDNGMFVPS